MINAHISAVMSRFIYVCGGTDWKYHSYPEMRSPETPPARDCGVIELWEMAVAMLVGHPLRQPILCLSISPSGRRQMITLTL